MGQPRSSARPRGMHKGTAITAFSAEEPFRGRIPVFLGDDRTDEDGFRAAQEGGGLGGVVADAEVLHFERGVPGSVPSECAVSLHISVVPATGGADGDQHRASRASGGAVGVGQWLC